MMDQETKALVWIMGILFGGPVALAIVGIIADAYVRTH